MIEEKVDSILDTIFQPLGSFLPFLNLVLAIVFLCLGIYLYIKNKRIIAYVFIGVGSLGILTTIVQLFVNV